MTRIVGIMPARMKSSRFPGKPLFKLAGRPMVEHCYLRAHKYPKWDALYLATCDKEIADFGRAKDWPVLMTSDKHVRALERVAEGAANCGLNLKPDDIVVCVQADEPMLEPEMIDAAIAPLLKDPQVPCTVLAMEIREESVFRDKNSLKIIHDIKGDVLYTSRAPIPYCERFTPELGVRRIYGIFGFRYHFLQTFVSLPESPLEIVESCDSNRIMDHGYRQRIAPYPYRQSFSVDSPADAARVEANIRKDPLWGTY